MRSCVCIFGRARLVCARLKRKNRVMVEFRCIGGSMIALVKPKLSDNATFVLMVREE